MKTTINTVNAINIISIVSFWGDAPEHDVAYSSNGGSYYQPHGGALLHVGNQDVVVNIDDTSCGDFGSRVFVTIECDTHKWEFAFGTMDDASINSNEELEEIWLSAGTIFGIGNLWDVISIVRDAIDIAAA